MKPSAILLILACHMAARAQVQYEATYGSATSSVARLSVPIFPPALNAPTLQSNVFKCFVDPGSFAGGVLIMQTAADLTPPVTWTNTAVVEIPHGGTGAFTDPGASDSLRYYRAKAILSDGTESYSVNTLGYVRRVMETGTNLVSNPFYTRNNRIGTLLPECPDGSVLMKFNGYEFSVAFFDWNSNGWDQPSMTLDPGEGAIFRNPDAPFTLALVGEVPQGSLANPIAGTLLKGSKAPANGLLDFPSASGQSILTWDALQKASVSHVFEGGEWNPVFSLRPGEAFWVTVSTPVNWIQSFIVNLLPAVETPFIYSQPANLEASSGATATFTVSATGTGPLAYQWRFNGANLDGATNNAYTIASVQTSSGGQYSVEVVSAYGSVVSSNATLVVPTPPTITSQPESRTNQIGTTATFTVVATGTAPLSYQWRFNGEDLEGATDSAYTIVGVQQNHGGQYSVSVTNLYGSITSLVATLTVLAPSRPFCLADYYYPACAGNQWVYDSHQGLDTWTTSIRFEAVGLPLTFYSGRNPVSSYQRLVNAVLYDQGDGSWTNYMGTGDGWGYLGTHHDGGQPDMRFDPGFIFTDCPSFGQTLSQTNDIYADGTYAGQGTFAIRLLDLADVAVPAGVFTGCLHLEVCYTIAGDTRIEEHWWAAGVGPVKWTHSAPGSTVPEVNELRSAAYGRPPRISVQPGNTTVSVGSTVIFTVEGTGDQPLGCEWHKNEAKLVNGGNISGVSTTNLILANVQTADAGDYSVVFSNACGSVMSTVATLTVVGGEQATWQGCDDFSGGISRTNWTVYPNNSGEVRVVDANGHASFIVPGLITGEDKAVGIVWRGQPTATDDWTVEVRGHDSATPSQLQLAVARTDGAGTSNQEAYRVSMARGSAGQQFNAKQWIPGDDITRASADATSADFGLRLVYHSGPRMIEAWYNPNGSRQGWMMLDTVSLAEFSPTMTASNTFLFIVNAVADHDHGPISEGDLWVDDFCLTGAFAPLRFAPDAVVANGLFVGKLTGPVNTSVIVQSSSNLSSWTSISTNAIPAGGLPLSWTIATNRLHFFRARLAP